MVSRGLVGLLLCGTVGLVLAQEARVPRAAAGSVAESAAADDPYLPSTRHLPPGVAPHPWHHLDAVRSTLWHDFPDDLAREYCGDSAAQRVIYRDSVTGAEVWLLARSPSEEGIAYTNYYPFNADGSLLRIWGINAILRTDGSGLTPLKSVIPHEFAGLPSWHKTDPDRLICGLANGGRYEVNLRTGERLDIFLPDAAIPAGTDIQFSEDDQHTLFISKQGSPPRVLAIGDGKGQNRREIPFKSSSKTPEKDRMGSGAFMRDLKGRLYFRYSLNKGLPGKGVDTPYQNWLVALDGWSYRAMDSQCNVLDDPGLHLLPAGSFVVTGHGGYSPSMQYFCHHAGMPNHKYVRTLATFEERVIARIPGCDHMDWTADDNWFFVWANQVGTPIYKTFVDTGTVQRIVASNSCPHAYGSCPYHGASPDGTKVVYKSSMLGGLDLYMAIVKHPQPPPALRVRREGATAVLEWAPPARRKEIRGYHVYRSARSGGGYVRLTAAPVAGLAWLDASPDATAHYVVTSVEHSGLESRVLSPEAALQWDGPVRLFWEAEDGTLDYPVREVFLPAECSANAAIARAVRDPVWEPLADRAGSATWQVAVPAAGEYSLWLRVRSRGGAPAAGLLTVGDAGPFRALCGQREWDWIRASEPVRCRAGAVPVRLTTQDPALEVDKLLLTTESVPALRAFGNTPIGSAPARPAEVSVRRDDSGDMVLLNWRASTDPQFHHYQVYRGDTPQFVPSQRALIGSPTRPAFIDPRPEAAASLYYRVISVDSWENVSEPSEAAALPVTAAAKPVSLMVELEGATLTGQAAITDDPDAGGGKAVACGPPTQAAIENAGSLSLPVDLPPGKYALWLRLKGRPEKNIGFFYVQFGDGPEHYSRAQVSSWFSELPWTWHRVRSMNTVSDPQERIMTYTVTRPPTALTLRHRANYFAADRAFFTTSEHETPAPDAALVHPGCDKAFPLR